MSNTLPERADVRQLRTQAKELLRSLNAAEPSAVALAATHDSSLNPSTAKLSDAQRLISRSYGFSSWPDLVAKVETPALLEQLRRTIDTGDAAALDALLKTKKSLRGQLNEPLFGFDSPPIVQAGRIPNGVEIARVLIKHGADPNGRSRWWAGGFGPLDNAKPELIDDLLSLGVEFDVWSAAAQGRADVLAELLTQNPELVNAPGGDGMRPLHFAKTLEVAKLLVDRGADLDVKDVDHESTPAQYHVKRPEILEFLIAQGAKPDIFIAVMLDDPNLLRSILEHDPEAHAAQTNHGDFATHSSDGGHIYLYLLGGDLSPLEIAAKFNKTNTFSELASRAEAGDLLIAYAWLEKEAEIESVLAAHPGLVASLNANQQRAIADAAGQGRTNMVRLLMEAGLDPNNPGTSDGTSLHVAAWFGYTDVVKLLIPRVDVETRDLNHGSTVLGWALHGAQYCRNPRGDYPKTVEALLEAGAQTNTPANKNGASMIQQAGDREDLKILLRQYGA